jgi:hypothetical protein
LYLASKVEEFLISSEEDLSSRSGPDLRPSNGSSIKELRPSSQFVIDTDLGTLPTQVDQADYTFGTPTQDGGKCSSTKLDNSSISVQEEFLMLLVVEMLKAIASSSGRDTTVSTRDGLSDTLIPSR